MALLKALSAKDHAGLHIADDSFVKFVNDKHMLAIRVTEISQAACDFPIFMTRQPNGTMGLSAVTSFQTHENLFIRDGQWNSVFRSSILQTYPLFLMQSEDGSAQPVLGIDDSLTLEKEGGQPLFDKHGKPALWLSGVKATLMQDIQNVHHTLEFCDALSKLDLFRAINIVVHYMDAEVHTITGLNTIHEDGLAALSSDDVKQLHDKGYFGPIYSMLSSLHQLNALIRRNNASPTCPKIKNITLEISKLKP